MSKNEILDEFKGLEEDSYDRNITVIVKDTIIQNTEFYKTNIYRVQLLENEKGQKYIKGNFIIDKKVIEYSELFKTLFTDKDTDTFDLKFSDQIDAESFSWFLFFTGLFKNKTYHYNPPKPANPVLLEGFTKNIDGRSHYDETEVQFYTILGKNIPLVVKLLQMCNYIDCPIFMYNCGYVLASYIRRTPSLEIIKHFKQTGLLANDAHISNEGCEDCDDEPIPETH